ncbi:MAG: thiamine biosynthesis Thi4 protein [Clostridia bacterium]|jgi:hypothetical protein|nr:thiamine biosynthesis Thi4 protein [Clostridia bacterium]
MRIISIRILFLLTFLATIITTSGFYNNTFSYDVVVIGSDPEGISASISSVRSGADVLLIDTRNDVGGLYTSGMLSMLDMNYITSGSFETVNSGFFKEFYNHLGEKGNIDIEETKNYFSKLLKDEKVTTQLNVSKITPIKQGDKVIGLSYIKDNTLFNVKGKVFIDTSVDAKFARAAGVPYKVGREELGMKNKYAAATLVFSVQGADWQKICRHLNQDDSIYTGANEKVAWGYPNMLDYVSLSNEFQLRRLNLSLQNDGSIVINAFQIFDTDSLNQDNIKQKYEAAVKELPQIIHFLNTHAVGFENAILYKYADELYIREGVRIIGEYTLTGEDVFNNVDFKNKIAYGSYPMDLQATGKDQLGGTILTSRNIYTLPITIMVPKTVDNLLVAGRSASYDPLSHSSARTVPVGMALGEAAGVLASYSLTHSLSVRECSLSDLHVKNIQKSLTASGVVLDTPLNRVHPEKSSYAYPHIVSLRKKALLSMEYNYKNDYRCSEAASFETISRILSLIRANSNIKLLTADIPTNNQEILTVSQIVTVFNQLLGTDFKSLKELYAAHIIDYTTYRHTRNKKTLLNEDVYAMMSGLVDFSMNNKRNYYSTK